MPGAIYHNEPIPQKKEPQQKTPKEAEQSFAFDRLGVGDVVQLNNGENYVITQIDDERQKFKGEAVRFQGNSWEPDPTRPPVIFNKEQITQIQTQNQDLRELVEKAKEDAAPKKSLAKEMKDSIDVYNQNQQKHTEQEELQVSKQEPPSKNNDKSSSKQEKKSHAASFSIISKGDTDGLVTSGNSFETIVTGETTDGVTFTAHSVGGNVSRAAIESRIDGNAKSADLANERTDESAAYDNLQDVVNQSHPSETVEISGGATINRDELGVEESVPNGTEFRPDEDFAFDSGFSETAPNIDITNHEQSLDELLASIPPHEATNAPASYDEAEIDDDGFEIGDEPWNDI